MKFKVGDRVRVRDWDDMAKRYGMLGEHIRAPYAFMKEMRNTCGKVYKIIAAGTNWTGNVYTIDNSGFNYHEGTLLPVNTRKIVITSDGVETLARLYEGNKVIKTATAKCSPDDTFDFETGANLAYERLMPKQTIAAAAKAATLGLKSLEKEFKKFTASTQGRPFKLEVGKQYKQGNLIIEITDALHTHIGNRYTYKVIAGKEDSTSILFFYEGSPFMSDLRPYEPPKYYNGKVVCIKSPYRWWTIGKVYNVVDGILTANDGQKYPNANRTPYRDADDIRHAGNDGNGDERHNPANEFVPIVE